MSARALIHPPIESKEPSKSLVINILGEKKVCSFNCVYCHLGPTTMTMNQIRREYTFPTQEEIIHNLQQKLQSISNVEFNTLTISGNGEPLLHPQAAEIITAIVGLRNQMAPHARVVILSNGAHIQNRKIVLALNLLDERIIKLDAGNTITLKKINNPLVRLTVDRLAQDIRKLKDCTLQTTFIQGEVANTSNEQIEDWLEVVGMIKPNKLHLMTPTQSIPNSNIQAVDEDTLETIASRVRRRLPSIEVSVFAR